MEYDSFGYLVSDSNPAFEVHIGYSGGLMDPKTNLIHFALRDYDSLTGRFMQRDRLLYDGR